MKILSMTDNDLRKALHNGIVSFSFRKKNGEIRRATGTTNLSMIRSINNGSDGINGGGYRRKDIGCVAFFDTENMGWRSYSEGSLMVVELPD